VKFEISHSSKFLINLVFHRNFWSI